MATLTDLDKLCALPREVRAGGRDWKVPGSPPVAWMLAAEQLSELPDDADDLAIVRAIREQVADLFLIHQPDEIDAIEDALGTLDAGVLLGAVRAIYADQGTEEEAEQERPTRPTSPTMKSASSRSSAAKRAAKTSRSRSSRS